MDRSYILYVLCIIVLLRVVLYRPCTIHIIHRIDPSNTGDMVSSCSNYFYFPNQVKHDIYKVDLTKIKYNDYVIFSGGGLFDNNDGWNSTINSVLDKCRNCYAWGVGINLHTNSTIKKPIKYNKFKRIGIRDYNHKTIPYLPCSSCMIPELRNKYTIKREYGVLEHIHHKINLDLPKLRNNKDIKEIIKFIGESKYIITNTYHCLYFSMLMGKKVILFEKFSSKFNSLRHQPVMYSGNIQEDLKKCKVYPDFHKECMKLNKDFYDKFNRDYQVRRMIGI